MIIKKFGKLVFPEGNDLNDLTFIIKYNTRDGFPKSFSLTRLFKQYENQKVGLAITEIRNGKRHKDIFNEIGVLQKYNGLWEINSVVVDHRLMDNVGRQIEIVFNDMKES